MKFITYIILMFVVVSTFTVNPSPISSQNNSNVNPISLLCLVNMERAKVNVRPLALDKRLVKAAQLHTNYMASTKNLTHDDVSGSLGTRISDQGFDWWMAGENIAYGFTGEEESKVMRAWMNSRGHRANILNRKFTHFGSGFKNNYWTQNFAQSANGYPPNVLLCPQNSMRINIQI
ncbi:CAP domain-containing protein [Glomus cerebriforme]|uniref:CAP domain-containing protein n=1 Tax=Glomus cerebriforme TaxID=658196 RepID=A0A397TML0_9GLOM|nr:CAP domain-containing protein [Glomus cerebriforme]